MQEDCPRSLREMERRLAAADACLDYLTRLRWGHGFLRPACGGKVGWEDRRDPWTCQSCRRQTTVVAGTIFAGTHLPLELWLCTVGWVGSQKSRASALGVKRVLGLGMCEAAWVWLHKLGRAPERHPR